MIIKFQQNYFVTGEYEKTRSVNFLLEKDKILEIDTGYELGGKRYWPFLKDSYECEEFTIKYGIPEEGGLVRFSLNLKELIDTGIVREISREQLTLTEEIQEIEDILEIVHEELECQETVQGRIPWVSKEHLLWEKLQKKRRDLEDLEYLQEEDYPLSLEVEKEGGDRE